MSGGASAGLMQAFGNAVGGLVAAGTTQATALALSSAVNLVTTVAAGAGVRLPLAQPGDEVLVYNGGASVLTVYPPVGHSIGTAATNAGASVPPGAEARFVKHSALTAWSTSSGTAGTDLTTAEAAAGLTRADINIDYEPGNVLRYGTNTTPGTTDMTAAIQAAVNTVAQAGGGDVFITSMGDPVFAIASKISIDSSKHIRIVNAGGGIPTFLWTGATFTNGDDNATAAMFEFTGQDHAFSGFHGKFIIDAAWKANFCVWFSGITQEMVDFNYIAVSRARLDGVHFNDGGSEGPLAMVINRLRGIAGTFSAETVVAGRYVVGIKTRSAVGQITLRDVNTDWGGTAVIGYESLDATGKTDLLLDNVRGECAKVNGDFIVWKSATAAGAGNYGSITMLAPRFALGAGGSFRALVRNTSTVANRPMIHIINFATNQAFTNLYQEDNDAANTIAYDIKLLRTSFTINATASVGFLTVGTGLAATPVNGMYYWDGANKTLHIYGASTDNSFHPALTGSAEYDPPNLVDGDGVTTTVAVTGVGVGDFCVASFSNELQGISLHAWVSAANTVSVRFQNETGATLDLALGILRARAWRR